ncbi:hypothetical protein M378DRAFT_185917 [Amanita muscaria Koide BX008]|uniref:Phosphoinositide phospholipase C n=1 Tax=Amanita muscaria (strain Koide BX008) TaxID=946122 RepID=A0A0C2XB42_AMAMK|nr:hypothetical protein M378DRAFT_185917 [Amanita muscaria Koide BX008]
MSGALRRIQEASKTFSRGRSWPSRMKAGGDGEGGRHKRKLGSAANARSQSDVGILTLTQTLATSPPPISHSMMADPLPELVQGFPGIDDQMRGTSATSRAHAGNGPVPRSNSSISTSTMSSAMEDAHVAQLLKEGTQMTKVTSKKRKNVIVKLNHDMGQIIWGEAQPLARQRIISIESIKEMRSGSDARYYREQFQLAQIYEDCWLTIIYILDGNYKTLHLIAPTVEVFRMWDTTLRKLHAIRQELMPGLGNYEMRQALWEKQYWKGSDLEANERLRFGEVEKLCKRMNIHSSSESLYRLFKQADVKSNGYLDFDDFRRFVKLLRGRPELDRLYKKLIHSSHSSKGGRQNMSPTRIGARSPTLSNDDDVFDFKTFEHFMREKQQSSLSHAELKKLFNKYATVEGETEPASASASLAPGSSPSQLTSQTNSMESSVSNGINGRRRAVMTLDSFTSFLMSADNSAFQGQYGKVVHDMTRPLSDYFISSSHNTYLVGHQLVGVSTIEGYIRALLHSCRSVEVDIYDGEVEPMIFHGKSFTSKVPLREVCNTIMKYGFVASPYPIVISAEVHCSVPQQDMIAEIMIEVFGDTLVKAPPSGKQKVTVLPSPEELKGKILFKTKDLTVMRQESSDIDLFTEMSGTSSASESDVLQERLEYEAVMRNVGSTGLSNSPAFAPATKSALVPSMQAARSAIRKVTQVGKSSTASSGSGSGGGGRGMSILGIGLASSPPPRSEPIITESLSSVTPIGTSALDRRPSTRSTSKPKPPKISPNLQSLMVYTVGVKFQGINKKLDYAPEHMFSLSETAANKMIKAGDGTGMYDLIKHCRTHLVRIYPKGLRVNSTNYEPHRYWSAGAQLVAMNWQTFDLGYMINHAMFQRNGRSGYVLKPPALQSGPGHKELLSKRMCHYLDLTIISAQQLPRLKDSSGKEIVDKAIIDPYVEVTVHVPDWTYSHAAGQEVSVDGEHETLPSTSPGAGSSGSSQSADSQATRPGSTATLSALSARSVTYRTSAVKSNGFNPVWEEKIRIPFECVGDMWDLVFVRFVVRQEDKEDVDPLAIYCVSLGSLGHGYRHLPLHDAQMSQYLFSTLFVRVSVEDVR